MKEMYKGMVNSPQTKLSKAINSADTDIYVKDGSVFPTGPNLAVIGIDQHAETILYSSVSNNILVGCTRGYQGEARAWDAEIPIARNFTEADLDAVQENIKALNKNKVSKENGKQLSTNDYTNEAKAKVDAIPSDPKYTDTVQDLSGYLKKSDVFDNKTFDGDESKLRNIPFSARQGVRLLDRLDRVAPNGEIDPSKILPKITIQNREPYPDSELQGILLSGALNELFLRTTKLNERKADKQYLYDILMGESLVTRKAGEWPVVHGKPTAIEYAAFKGNQLIAVTIPPSVTAIGYAAFKGNQLTEVKVPKNCTVASGAFDAGVNIIRY